MNIQVIAEHSVDFDLLPTKANILDLGCRGMHFAKHMRLLGHNVIAIDIDDLKESDYMQIAIGRQSGRVGIKRNCDPQATTMCSGDDVDCVTIEELCKRVGIEFFDLIKCDIEGAEFELIMSMDRPYCKQFSWEAHLHTGVYGQAEIIMMENKLLNLEYFPVKHDMTRQHGLSYNFWDSLWTLV